MNVSNRHGRDSDIAKRFSAHELVYHAFPSVNGAGENTPNGRYLNELAAALGVTVDWLLTGGDAPASSGEQQVAGYHNVEPAVIPQGTRVPVLSYVQAGNWHEMCEQATAFDGNVEYVTAGVDVGPCGFGLWLRGQSMEPFFKGATSSSLTPTKRPNQGISS